MSRPLDIEVANFVCRFGSTLVMNDLLEEVVLPAFFRQDERSYSGTKYFFTDQAFEYLTGTDINSLSLRCRFIKSTVIRRHQTYSPSTGVVQDEKSLDTAPSALAILLLKSHRLIYMREVPGAPSPAQFGATFSHLLRLSMTSYRNHLYQQGVSGTKKVTKASLAKKFPNPDVDVIPVVSKESLGDFVKRFETLNTLKLELAPTNSELDNSEFFRMLRQSNEKLSSQKTTVQHQSSSGLNKKECVRQVEAAKQGNLRVAMRGVDTNGDELKGNNENFSVRATIDEPAEDVRSRAVDAYEKYEEMVEEEVVTLGATQRDDAAKLKEIHDRHRNRRKS